MSKHYNWLKADYTKENIFELALGVASTIRSIRDTYVAEGSWSTEQLDEVKRMLHDAVELPTWEIVRKYPGMPLDEESYGWLKYTQVTEPTEMSEYWMYTDPENDRLMLVHRPWTKCTGVPKMTEDGSVQMTQKLYDYYVHKAKPIVKEMKIKEEIEAVTQPFSARLVGSCCGNAYDVIRPEEEVTFAFEYTLPEEDDNQAEGKTNEE